MKLNFSLTQLEYVLAVQRHGHFAKAAAACNVTQPTLSMQIQKLEEDLGAHLFDRSKKPILLTDMGQRLVVQMQSIMFEAKKLESLAETVDAVKAKGRLKIGVIPTIAPYLLPRLLPVMEQRYVDIELDLEEMQTHRIVEALNSDDIDVGLLATPLRIPQIFEHALYYEPFQILCRKDHELAENKRVRYRDLKFSDIWLLTEGHCLRNQVLDVCSLKKNKTAHLKYEFESGSLETLKNLVNSYRGYTLLPQLATENVGAKTLLIPFERPIPAREVGLVYRRKHYKTELVEALTESIVECIPDEIRRIRQKDLDVLPVAD